jgi:phage baseplate assembly protein W
MKDIRNWQVSINNPAEIVEGAEDIAQCLYVIITTVKGSDPLRADFGSDVYQYIDKPLDEIRPSLIYSLTDAIQQWEPRIKVKKITPSVSNGTMAEILIEAEVIASASQITINVTL